MEIFVNGAPRQTPTNFSIAELLTEMGLPPQRLAVEINLEIVPRSRYATQQLTPGDRVELVQAVGGG